MSTTPPPEDRPTEPLRPGHSAPAVAAPAVDPNVILLRLEDTIGSLRTGLMVVGVIAVAALGVAIYALLSEQRGDTRDGSRTAQLEDRVDRLSRQIQNQPAAVAGGGSDTAALDQRVDALERTVKTLASRPATDATKAVEELAGRIDALSRDVEQLKQAQPTP